MRIAVLSEPGSFHTQKWTNSLQKKGAEVTVFSFSSHKIPGIRCVQIEPRFTRKGKLTYFSYLFSADRLKRELVTHKIDVVNPINITPFGVWGQLTGFKPMVSVAMGADILEYPPLGKPNLTPLSRFWEVGDRTSWFQRALIKLKQPIFRWMVSRALKHSVHITGDNLVLTDTIHDWFGIPKNKIHLNRWGIEEELFKVGICQLAKLQEKYKILPGQKVLISPRGSKPIYQGDIILESFEMMLKRGMRDVKFIMLSAGYEVPKAIRSKAEQLQSVFPNFHFEHGVIPREEMCALWNLADCFISAPVYDGYSNALSEGRYIGAVPFVNDIPAHQELIHHEENGWVIDPFTPQNLAEEVSYVMKNLRYWKEKFSRTNRDWILENALLDQNMEAFLSICYDALDRKKSFTLNPSFELMPHSVPAPVILNVPKRP